VVDCCLVAQFFSRRQFASGGCRSHCFSLLCCVRSYTVRVYIYLFYLFI
jgi:hypothetical protein